MRLTTILDALTSWAQSLIASLGYPGLGLVMFLENILPVIPSEAILKVDSPHLGGSWLSLAGVTLGSIFVWVSIFIVPVRGVLYGIGFALYALAMLHPIQELFEITRDGLKRIEAD